MKTKSFSLNNKELLLVELPEGANRIHVFNDNDNSYISYFKGVDTGRHYIDFKAVLIGKLPEVTEEQYKTLVTKVMNNQHYQSYNYKSPNERWTKTAKESFFSALTANGILFENPLGSHPDNWIYKTEAMHMKNTDISAWQSAQEKVFNIDNTFLFEKV